MSFGYSAFGQTEKQKEQITSRYDKQKLQQLKIDFSAKAVLEKQRAFAIAQQRGWQTKFTTQDGRLVELQKVVNGKPIYYTTFNVAAAKSTRVDHLNSGGSLGLNLDGQNMTAYVWDGGVARASHQEYDGAGGNNRFSTGDSGSLNYHSAHVTGTIIASGVQANAKGMAPHADAIGYDWNSDLAEATTAAANGMLISNHSYGYATRNQQEQVQLPQYYFGGYINNSRDWDNLMFNAPNYLMVVAAGNDGTDDTANNNPTGGYGFDKLTGHSTSKNNLVVAAANDANIDSNGNLVSVTIATFSSEGPTDDFRIKPDIAGNGVSVYSTYESSDTAYNSISGTSMASPNVAGSLVLLQQHANNVSGSFLKAATLKGLALHTADDAGAFGPDAIFGWGLLNTKAAAEAITQNGNESKIEELTLTSGQTYTITVDSDGVNDLLASISWTDRAGIANTGTVNLTTPVLVNDLDIRVTQGGTTSFPYELTGALTNAQQDNNVDPYERVDVANASGTYTITVTHKGSLTGGSQNFSLVVTGLSGAPVVCNATTPTGLSIDGFGSSTATVSWDAVPAASYDLRYRQTGTSTWTTNAVSGASSSLTGLTPETTYEVQVRSKCVDNSTSSYSSSSTFTTTEVQLNYCASNGNSVVDEYISNVSLGSINNTTGASSSGYADYTSQSTSLTQGDNYTISVTPTWTGTLYNEGYSVWIDYNHDGDFDDAGEQVWSQAVSKTTPVSGSFTIPNSTYVGNTRMRVTMQYNAVPSSCGSFNFGEVEDYTVNLGTGTLDTTKPVITLNGASTINLNVGDTYTEEGATAFDNYDGDLTSNIVIGGDVVDGNTSGTYVVTYNVSDVAGNAAAEVTRTVNVTTSVECTPTTSSFSSNSLNHSGTGSTTTTLNFTGGNHEDVTFTITELNSRTGGNPSNRFIDQVVVTYVDGNGISQNFGTFTGNTTSTVNVSIPGVTQSVTIALSDAFDGNAGGNMSVSLSSVQSCVTLNCTDSDGDGVCDEVDQCPGFDDSLIGTSCDDGDSCTINDVYGPECNCAGTFADSDGDGVCDADDICPGGNDTIDVDGNGVPDDCDCSNDSGSFSPSTLNHPGGGSSAVSFSFSSLSRDVSFSISGLDAIVNGNPRNRFEEVATVTIVNANGETQTFNSYSGANQTTANVTITEFISEVTVSLSNGVSGSSTSLSISLSSIAFCAQNSTAVTNIGLNSQIKDFTVFPNPATTELNIRFGLGTANDDVIDVSLNIYDLTGKIVKRMNWARLSNPNFERQINISSLENGIYLIGLETSNGTREFLKLIKK